MPSYRIIEPSGPFLWRKSNFRLTFQQLPKSLSSYLRKLSKRAKLWRRNVWQRRIHPLKGKNPSQKPINLAPIYTVVNQPLLTWNSDKDRFGPAFNNFWQTAFECVELKRKFISFLANNAYLATSGMQTNGNWMLHPILLRSKTFPTPSTRHISPVKQLTLLVPQLASKLSASNVSIFRWAKRYKFTKDLD